MITIQILSKIHDETQKHLTKKIKHNLELQKKLTFQVGSTLTVRFCFQIVIISIVTLKIGSFKYFSESKFKKIKLI
jgi:hypothetical protein